MEVRHYCRNQRCRSKLKAPVESLHHAFCTPGCYEIFYHKRCLACERPLRNARRSFCPKPAKCANLVRTWPQKYRWPGYCRAPLRSAHFTGAKMPPSGDRPSPKLDRRIVPDARWPGMYRIRLPGGGLSDMVNLTRAKDALAELIGSRP
jgi:hypothetical protein